MAKKILILGANSFSGQDFIDLLLDDRENEVVGVGRAPERTRLFLKYKDRDFLPQYRYHQIDMNLEMPKLMELIDAERPQYIVNFVSLSDVASSWAYPADCFQTNCVSMAALAGDLYKKDYLSRYLSISSPEVYGTCVGTIYEDAVLNPSTPYAASKAAADMLFDVFYKQFDFPVLTVRATNVYGARQQLHKIIPRTVIYVKMGRKIELHGGGSAVKSYIHIRDVSQGELAALERGKPGSIYHLSPATSVTIRGLVSSICWRLGKTLEESTVDVDERPGQDAAYVIDSSKALREFGWRAGVSFDEGLEETIAWVNYNWDEIQMLPLDYQHEA